MREFFLFIYFLNFRMSRMMRIVMNPQKQRNIKTMIHHNINIFFVCIFISILKKYIVKIKSCGNGAQIVYCDAICKFLWWFFFLKTFFFSAFTILFSRYILIRITMIIHFTEKFTIIIPWNRFHIRKKVDFLNVLFKIKRARQSRSSLKSFHDRRRPFS